METTRPSSFFVVPGPIGRARVLDWLGGWAEFLSSAPGGTPARAVRLAGSSYGAVLDTVVVMSPPSRVRTSTRRPPPSWNVTPPFHSTFPVLVTSS
jgi:hypothetical protein